MAGRKVRNLLDHLPHLSDDWKNSSSTIASRQPCAAASDQTAAILITHAFVRPRTIPRSSQRDIWRQVGNSNALMRVLIRWSVESATTVDSYAGHLKGRMDVIWRILQSVMRNPAASFDLGDLIMDALNQQHASDGRADWSLNGPL